MTADLSRETLYRAFEDAVGEAYIFDVTNFHFVLVNRTARENLGFTMDELRQLAPWDLKPKFTKETFLDEIAGLLSGSEQTLKFETVHRRKDGSDYEVFVELHVIEAEGERLLYAAIKDISKQKETEAKLQALTRRLDAILNNTTMSIFMMDHRQHCIFMNKAAERLTGYTFPETQGRPLHDVIHHTHPDGRHFPIEECAIDRAFPENDQVQGEGVFVHKNGTFYPVGFTASPMHDAEGYAIGTVIEVRDISEELRAREAMKSFNDALQHEVQVAIGERERIEKQLQQTQKMETIGQLTGGVAHDFNNLLQVIGGSLSLLEGHLANDHRAHRLIENAMAGVTRGAKLTSQLLSFARRQPLDPDAVNLSRIVRDMDTILRRVLGDGVEVETIIGGGLWNCFIDVTQFESALLNLAVNARDAMEGFGRLTIEVGNASIDDDYAAKEPDVRAGQYVCLAVTDTGAGIPADVLDRVFDPFFTTKAEGQGTGLGLSMVYGFIKQSGGHIKIYSEVGHGTTVRIYLPRSRLEATTVTRGQAEQVRGGTERILVVEDDAAVRHTNVEMLRELGYDVLQAANGDAALAVIDSGIVINLLFTDVVMPGTMRTPDFTRAVRARCPNVAVLYTSGYTQNAIVHAGKLDDGVDLLSKPFSRNDLARKVRQVLASHHRSDATAPTARPTALDQSRLGGGAATPSSNLRILVLEDEALIRMMAVDMLESLGHHVVEAGSIAEAREIMAGDHAIQVMLVDVNLPDGSGIDFVRDVVKPDSQQGIIIASGSHLDGQQVNGIRRLVQIAKPFLQQDVREALEKLQAYEEDSV